MDTRKIVKTKGIVLAETNFSEADKMLTMFTPDLGKISCVAKGARKIKNKLMPTSQMFSFCDVVLYRGNSDNYYINSAELIESFYPIRTDYDKLELAMYCTTFINKNVEENQASLYMLKLLLNTIYLISVGDKNLNLIKCVYELKSMCFLGYTPRISNCVECGNKDILGFSVKKDGMLCNRCGMLDKSLINLKPGTFSAIHYIVNSNLNKLFSFDVTGEIISELKLFNKIYMEEKLE